jgi:hypothetical protein
MPPYLGAPSLRSRRSYEEALPTLRVVDSLLGQIHVDHSAADSAPAPAGAPARLEAMPGRDRHSAGGDFGWADVAEPAVAQRADGLGGQPAELVDRLQLAVVLGEVDVDELLQPRCLD